MRLADRIATATVKAASLTLPRAIRDRYREQWLADLRDANEGGVPTRDIVFGSIAFTISVSRPITVRPGPISEAGVKSRARLAAGLALSAALLSLSQYANIAGFAGQSWNPVYDFVVAFGTTLLGLYAVLAPATAAVLVTATRGISARLRLAVWLLVLASLTAPVQVLVDRLAVTLENYSSPGSVAYLAGAALTIAATVLLLLEFPLSVSAESRSRRLGASVGGAVAVAVTVATGIAIAAGLWNGRVPLRFVEDVTSSNQAFYDEWLMLKERAEGFVTSAFVGWAIGGLVLVVLILALGFSARMTVRRSLSVAGMAFAIAVMVGAAEMNFLFLMESTIVPSSVSDALWMIGRWSLVLIVLASVGGIRFAPKSPARTSAV